MTKRLEKTVILNDELDEENIVIDEHIESSVLTTTSAHLSNTTSIFVDSNSANNAILNESANLSKTAEHPAAGIFVMPTTTTQTRVGKKREQHGTAKKKAAENKKKKADDKAFLKAITAVEKKMNKSREKALAEFACMNEAARQAYLQKFAPVATRRKWPAAEASASQSKSSKLNEDSTDGNTTEYEDPDLTDLD